VAGEGRAHLADALDAHVPAGEREANGGGKAGNTRADNDNVRICHSHKMSKSNVKKQAEDE